MTLQRAQQHNTKIAFIGCGNMAQAIIAGIIKSGWHADQIIASNPSDEKLVLLAEQHGLSTTNDNLYAANFAEIIVLAVKPQKLTEVCNQLAKCRLDNKLIISVAAGFPIHKIISALAQPANVIRAMPNTPALIGMGATGLFAESSINSQQRTMAESIFNAVGLSCWVEKESLMDVVTAIAGSSPAYFFLMMQAMVEQAVATGLNPEQARSLVTQAMSGSAQLAQRNDHKSLATLRKEVTSPGGTTAAAITSFIHDDFEDIVKKAVKSSINRGIELANLT